MSDDDKDLLDHVVDETVDVDNPIGLIKQFASVMEWISNTIPWWVFIVVGLLVAIVAPLLV